MEAIEINYSLIFVLRNYRDFKARYLVWLRTVLGMINLAVPKRELPKNGKVQAINGIRLVISGGILASPCFNNARCRSGRWRFLVLTLH